MAILPVSSVKSSYGNINFGSKRQLSPHSQNENDYYDSTVSKLKTVPVALMMAMSPSLLNAGVPGEFDRSFEPETMEMYEPASMSSPTSPDAYNVEIRQKPNVDNAKILSSVLIEEKGYDPCLINLISTDDNIVDFEEVEILSYDKNTGNLKSRGIVFGVQTYSDEAYYKEFEKIDGIKAKYSQYYKPIGVKLPITNTNDYELIKVLSWKTGILDYANLKYAGEKGGDLDRYMRQILASPANNGALELFKNTLRPTEEAYNFMVQKYNKRHNIQRDSYIVK